MTTGAAFAIFLRTVASLAIAFGAIPFHVRARAELRVRLFEVLAATVRRGLPLGQALAAAIDDHWGADRRALRRILDELGRGATLSTALEQAGRRFFPPATIAAVRAAEGEGDLALALEAAAREELGAVAVLH